MSQIEDAYNIKLIYHYTESGHGKGPSDGHGAAVKKRIDRLILGGKIINNGYQAYFALVQAQSDSVKQKIIFVPPMKMAREAPPKQCGLKTVHGTQKFHMISTKQGSPGVIVCSDLSCTCTICVTDQEGPCFFGKYRHAPENHRVLDARNTSFQESSSSSSILLDNEIKSIRPRSAHIVIINSKFVSDRMAFQIFHFYITIFEHRKCIHYFGKSRSETVL